MGIAWEERGGVLIEAETFRTGMRTLPNNLRNMLPINECYGDVQMHQDVLQCRKGRARLWSGEVAGGREKRETRRPPETWIVQNRRMCCRMRLRCMKQIVH